MVVGIQHSPDEAVDLQEVVSFVLRVWIFGCVWDVGGRERTGLDWEGLVS